MTKNVKKKYFIEELYLQISSKCRLHKKENLQQVTSVTLPQRIYINLRDFKMKFNNLFPMI